MLPADEIQRSLAGAWRLMTGKPDGLRLLDLSAEGFWNSFQALLVAAPALIIGWVAVANDIADPLSVSARFSMAIRLAVVDLGSWILPLVGLALVAPYAGIGNRFVHYVVASNWASAIIAWLQLPGTLLKLFMPRAVDTIMLAALLLFIIAMVLSWRMTNAAIGKGAAIGSAVFAGMFVASLIVIFTLQALLGIQIPT
ncbi:transporter [Aquamicrobium lusatiense]|uniref:Transporter n=1 Tax=Aquamicrobium lusatiense TaxID=89772 RepID=A0A7W9S076_9HYPH|nr:MULTISPECIES: transporter [Aquamicrobium]MBB6011707.1 hypothetical protein [Aquamicrobium lusatiense]MCK9553640.1 transporter [Aquamicrobium sp.]MDH4992192.1 transporter [Aquamicrobium lusatiense]